MEQPDATNLQIEAKEDLIHWPQNNILTIFFCSYMYCVDTGAYKKKIKNKSQFPE